MINKRTLVRGLAGSLVALAVMPGAALAQQWPAQPVKLIIPFSAGGPTDALGRQLAKQLQGALGQPVVVENVLGASGQIALEKANKSPADGYTIVLSANTIQAIAPNMGKLPYDTIKGFTPLGGLAGFAYAVTVSNKSPITSVADLIARAKAAPGKLSAGSAGVGTGGDLAIKMLGQAAGTTFNVVAYKGAAPVLQDLIGGHIDFTIDLVTSMVPMWRQGTVKALATTGKTRHKVINNVPTVGELYPGYEFVAWYALYGPADLPPAVVRRYSDELLKIQKTPEFMAFLEDRGFDAIPATSDELGKMTRDELAKWADIMSKIPKTP